MENKPLTVIVPGDLLSTNAQALRVKIDEVLNSSKVGPGNTFRLDLSRAKMVDSVGLNLVVSVLKEVQQRGARMQITCSNQNVLRTFIFIRLDQQIKLVKV